MLRSLALFAILLASHAASAQLYLFEDRNFGGRQFPALESFPGFQYAAGGNWADRAASARVFSGQWQLCGDTDFRGRCVTLGPGDYPSLAAVGLGAGAASARNLGGPPGGGGPGWGGGGGGGGARGRVVLFDRGGLGGGQFGVDGPVRDLERAGFNDRARSMVVNEGTWELCSDAEFHGNCATFRPGRYDDLGRLNGRVSSLRPAGGGPPGGGWAGGGGGPGRRGGAILFQGPNLTGRDFVVDAYVANLGGTGFNDKAQSLRIERGRWIFCSDADFRGECRTFGPGDYPSLPRGLSGRVSSGRKVSD